MLPVVGYISRIRTSLKQNNETTWNNFSVHTSWSWNKTKLSTVGWNEAPTASTQLCFISVLFSQCATGLRHCLATLVTARSAKATSVGLNFLTVPLVWAKTTISLRWDLFSADSADNTKTQQTLSLKRNTTLMFLKIFVHWNTYSCQKCILTHIRMDS